jgi:hypothetical protein
MEHKTATRILIREKFNGDQIPKSEDDHTRNEKGKNVPDETILAKHARNENKSIRIKENQPEQVHNG